MNVLSDFAIRVDEECKMTDGGERVIAKAEELGGKEITQVTRKAVKKTQTKRLKKSN